MSETNTHHDHSDLPDESVVHEAEVADAVDAELRRASTHAAIADPGSPSASYTQAEAVATNNAVKGILAVLRDEGILPTA